MRQAIAVLSLGIAGLAAFAWPSAAPAPAAPPLVAPPPTVPPPPPAAAAVLAAAPSAADHRRDIELPDGNFVPALNGAVGARPIALAWGDTPWSPIIGTERSDAGVDWYVHADGSRSTTEMKFRSDLGRLDAMTRVAHPGPAPGTAAPH